MPKTSKFIEGLGREIICPACRDEYGVPYHALDHRWSYNGEDDSPTFSPSLKVSWDFGDNREPRICHSFIENGQIRYLSDCTHSMAGQTVDLAEFVD